MGLWCRLFKCTLLTPSFLAGKANKYGFASPNVSFKAFLMSSKETDADMKSVSALS